MRHLLRDTLLCAATTIGPFAAAPMFIATAQEWRTPIGIYQQQRSNIIFRHYQTVEDQREFIFRAQLVFDDMAGAGSPLSLGSQAAGLRPLGSNIVNPVVPPATFSTHHFGGAFDFGIGGKDVLSPISQVNSDQPGKFFKLLLAADQNGLSWPLLEDYPHFEGAPQTRLDPYLSNSSFGQNGVTRLTTSQNLEVAKRFFERQNASELAALIAKFEGLDRRTDLYLQSLIAHRFGTLSQEEKSELSLIRANVRAEDFAASYGNQSLMDFVTLDSDLSSLFPSQFLVETPLRPVPYSMLTSAHYATPEDLGKLKLTLTESQINNEIRNNPSLWPELTPTKPVVLPPKSDTKDETEPIVDEVSLRSQSADYWESQSAYTSEILDPAIFDRFFSCGDLLEC